MANSGRFEYTIGFKTDDSGLKQARKALQEIQNLSLKPETGSKEITEYNSKILDAKESASKLEAALTNAFNIKMGSTSVQALNQELKKLNLNDIYTKMKAIGPEGESAFNKIALQAMQTNLQIKKSNTLLDKFGKTLWRNFEWLISGNLIHTVTGVFTKAYGYTKNLDESLNNIRIVTGKGADEMERFGKEAQETAAKLGKGTTDITNASLIFYQQGLDKAEVDERTEVATKLANVSQQSAETTADQLTAVWNGFQAGTDELEHYADVMTAIAANTASSSSELAGAISKVSSVAHTTGVDMEQLSAMISTVISVTRDSPETVGTAFKTIFARMDDLVEDGTDEFGVSLGRVSSHLKAMGIEILNEDGSLRDLGNTLTETGEKWKSYSREQQVAIAEQMGGKRQWNQVIALFDNWDKYKDALDVAKDSTGALQEQQDIYMESTKAHLQAVKTAWEGVYGEMMTADNINTVVDAFTKVLNTVENFIKGVGGIQPILLAVSSLMVKSFSGNIAQGMLNAVDNFKAMKYNAAEMRASQELTTQFHIKDNALLDELVPQYNKLLQMKKSLSEADIKRFKAYAEEREALNHRSKKLSEILEKEEKVVSKYKTLNDLYNKNNKEIDKVDLEQINNRKETGEVLQQGQAYNQSLVLDQSLIDNTLEGTAEKRLENINQKINLIEKEKQALQEKIKIETDPEVIQSLQSEIDKFNNVQTVLDSASEKMEKLMNGTSITEQEMNDLGDALYSAGGQLDRVKFKDLADSIMNSGKALGQFSQNLNNLQHVTEAGEQQIHNIIGTFGEMEKEEALTSEQTQKLKLMYQDLLKILQENPNMSLQEMREEFEKTAQKAGEVGGEMVQDMDLLLGNIPKQARSSLNEVNRETELWKDEFQNILNSVNFKNVVQNVTRAISATGQLASGIQMINNLPSIWNNMDISTGEKVTQTITSSTAALGMLLGGLSTFIPLLGKIATNLLVNIALEKLKTQTDEALVAAQIKKQVALKALLEKKEKSVIVNGVECTSIEAVVAEYHKETAAIMADSKVKAINIGLTTMLTAAAIALVAIIISVAVKTLIAVNNFNQQTESMKKAAETSKKIIEKNNEIIKQAEEIKKVQKSWEELWDSYKEGKTVTDDMKTSTSELVDMLEDNVDGPLHYAENIANLTGNYKNLNEQIKQFLELNNIEYEDALEGNAAASVSAIANEERSNVRSNMTNSQKKLADEDPITQFIGGLQETFSWKNASNALHDYVRSFATTAAGIVFGIAGSTVVSSLIPEKSPSDKAGHFSSTSTGLKAKEDDPLLQQYKAMYGDSNVWLENGEIYVDYEIGYQKKSDAKIVDTMVKERQLIKDQLKDAEKGTDEYIELEGRLKTFDEKLADYDKQLQDRRNNAVKRISVSDFQNLYVFDDSLSDKTLETKIRTAKKEYEEFIKKIWIEEGYDFTDEELKNAVNANFKDMFPDSADIIAKGEQTITTVDNQVNTIKEKLAAAIGEESEDVTFTEKGLDIFKQKIAKRMNISREELEKSYDFSDVDGNLLLKLFTGEATPEEFKQAIDQAFMPPQSITDFSLDLKGLGNDFEEISKKINEGDLNGNNAGENKAFGEMQGQLQELLAIFPENEELAERIKIFNDTTKMGTKEYADNLKWLQNYINDSPVDALNKKIDNVVEKWQAYSKNYELTGKLNLDANEFENDLEKILDADRQINIEVKAKIDSNIEEIKTKFDNASSAFGKIGEGFTIAADDLNALQAVMDATDFQKLLDSATVAADGQIQLNENVVNSAIEAAKKQIDTEYELQDQKLAVQQQILEAKDAVYQQMKDEIKAKKEQNAGKVLLEEDLNELMNQLSADSERLKLMNEDQAQIASDDIKKKDLAAYASFYSEVDAMDAEWNDNRTKRLGGADIAGKDFTKDYQNFDLYDKHPEYTKHNEADGYVTFEMVQDDTMSKDKVDAYLQKLWDDVDSNQAANQEDIEAIKVQRNFLKVKRESATKSWDGLLKSFQKTTDATKDNTDATKDNAEAQQELVDLLNEEIDAYHDLNNELKILGIRLDKVKKQQSKLVDQDLKNNLSKQIDILNQYMETDQRYLDKLNTDAALKRIQLEEYGVTFNEDGAIANSNYSDTLLKAQDELRAKQEWYNSLSKEEQEWAKEQLEAQEKSYEQLKDLITEYEDILLEQIPNMVNDISDKFDEKIEAQISIWKIDIDLKLNEASKKRTRLEFQQFMADIAEEDILGNTAYTMNTLATYLGKNGDIQVTRQQYEELLEMKKRLEGGDTSTIYGDNMAKLQEDLDSAEQSWMESEKAAKELQKTIKDNLLKLYDQAAEKLKEQRNLYKEISDILDHDMNLIKLRFGDASFGKLSNLLEQQKQLAYKQLNSALAERDYYGEQLQKALDKDPNMKEKVTQELATHFREAVNTASSLTIELVEKIKSGFENTFNEIFANAMEKITGESNLAVLTSEWDRAKESAEKYYDTINGAYEIEKLQLQIQKEINNSNDPAYQKRLTTFMRDQVQLLRSKDKLSKYDVERANALFDIEIKRAAFQEAQNNKTKMRLRRDSSGNYSYQFVSDENNVQDAITALAEAQNKLYNIDKDAFKDNVEDVQKILSDMQQKLLEDAQNGGRRQNEIQQYYIGLITNLVKDNEEIRQNYQATTFDQLSKLTEQGIEDFYKLGQSEREALMIAQDPLFGAGLAKALETPERFLSTLNTTVEETKELTLNYMNEFDDVMDRVEKNWEDLVKGSDPMVDGITTLTTSTEELIQQITTDTEKLVECVDQLSNHSLNLANTWELLGDAVADVLDLFNGGVGFTDSLMQILEDAKKVIKDVRNTDEMNSVSNGTNNNQTSQFNSNQNIQNKKVFSSEEWPQIGDKVRYLGGQYYEDSQGNGQAGDRGLGNFVEVYNIQKDAPYPISVISNNSAYGWLKKDQIAKFDNGGYTGNWETTKGKLAVLHPQELVLNASQTKGLVSFLNSKIHELSANALRGIVTPNIGSRHLVTESPQITNVNNIEANFPNVSVASEIEKAFMDLENLATQNAFKIYN